MGQVSNFIRNDEIVTLIIEHSPKLLFKFNKNNDSVLHVAARGGHISTVKKLLASYANYKKTDIAKAWLDYTGYEEELEDYDAMSNMEDILYFVTRENFQGNTMLHEAMLCGNKKNIDRDNNIFKICEIYNSNDRFGRSLSKCCYEYALDIVNLEKKSVLYIAVEKGDMDAVKLILEKSPKNDTKPEGLSPVVAAIMMAKKDSEMLRMILEKKRTWIHSSDKDERLPLHYAASIGYVEGVDLLLHKCKCCTIQRDKYGYFPIHLASYGGYLEVVKKFLEYCPDPTEMLDNFYGQNILHVASNYGKHKVVKYILKSSQTHEYHKMINQQDKNGDTPLHLAARSCHPTVVYYLVNHKRVSLDLVNKNKETALDIVNLFDRSSLRQHLTWTALTSAGVKPSSTRSLAHYIESKQSDSNSPKETEQDKDKNQNHVEESSQQNENKENVPDYIQPKNLFTAKGSTAYKDRVETILLVSTLIVTASVAACFAVPGEAADGKANNLCHIMFQLFIIFITISLFSAISSTIILFWATIGLAELVTNSLNIVMPLLGIALISLSLAFMAGLYTVISELTWLANVFLFMTVTFVVVVIFLYMLLFVPSSSTNMPFRYISHYPYLFLASLAEHQIDDDQEGQSQEK
ncbi:protein ACCELERATED CELL DEATH 6-like [Trifolium pratense]|uniref:protein ACCELERATED CELL DEATH 6-like n=1 Tax=Trifolium pratense TaxID=57577 RepID=UPI001E693A56|nr:protein ACCELERATED CELL DEATH 6-like [Trifolium pratense]